MRAALRAPHVTVLRADALDVPRPRNPSRVVANPRFGRTAAILRRRHAAAAFNPRPSVDAAELVITRRDPPLLPAREFERHAAFVRTHWPARPHYAGLHSQGESANMG